MSDAPEPDSHHPEPGGDEPGRESPAATANAIAGPASDDATLFAALGVILSAAHVLISMKMRCAAVAWSGVATGGLLIASVAAMQLASRRGGRAAIALLLSALQPGLGQMAMGRFAAGAGLVAASTALFLSGHWHVAYWATLGAAAAELALRARAESRPPPALGIRLLHCAALFLAVMSVLGAFVHSGGLARGGVGGDVVVVLGGGESGTATRAARAAELMKTGLYRELLVVGLDAERKVARKVFADEGLPEALRIRHFRATNTFESVAALPPGLDGAVVVTSRYHLARTDLFWRALGRSPATFEAVEDDSVPRLISLSAREALSLGAYLSALPWALMGPASR